MIAAATLSAIVSLLVGRPVPVTCQPTMGAYTAAAEIAPGTRLWAGVGGYYRWGYDDIGLTPQTCTDLARLIRDGYTWQRGYAVFTLAHEAGHASGIYDEEQADCYGAGHAAGVMWQLGVRRRAAFVALRRDGLRLWGYNPIPASCFP